MATPTRSQGVSTPKNTLTLTPNRPTASPRPHSSVFPNRAFSYKSPATTRTPIPTHGHGHRVSVSSHPTSTPMAAPALQDDLLGMNSPAAALMASMGTTGLTPMPSGQDGLGITTGITPTPIRDTTIPRNPEAERLQRLQEVANSLRIKAAGRGITREGVERVAQTEGFTTLWDDDNLTVAGNSVDLEIFFHLTERDRVRDVVLKLNTSDTEDSQLQRDASAMLKIHLTGSEGHTTDGPWQNLSAFSTDLQYLSQHDHLDSTANCFEVVDELYQTFRKIWNEEKKRMKARHDAYHICHGNVGKPVMDRCDRLGPSTTYWLNRHDYVGVAETGGALELDKLSAWTASFSCQNGEPSISSDRDWLGAKQLSDAVTTEHLFQDNEFDKPDWQQFPSNQKDDEKDGDKDAMDIDKLAASIPQSLHIRFVCDLEPVILLPINVITELNAQTTMVLLDENKVLTYQQALQEDVTSTLTASTSRPGDARWTRSVTTYDKAGVHKTETHAYMLYSQGGAWCLPTQRLMFEHPRQFAEALPILRQHALLWTLLRNTVTTKSKQERSSPSVPSIPPIATTSLARGIIKRSNKKGTQAQLENILHSQQRLDQALNVDISMDLVSDVTKARLAIYVPAKMNDFANVVVEVKRNGVIDVASITGPGVVSEEKLRANATKVLKLSEDIGIMIQWLLRQLSATSQA